LAQQNNQQRLYALSQNAPADPRISIVPKNGWDDSMLHAAGVP